MSSELGFHPCDLFTVPSSFAGHAFNDLLCSVAMQAFHTRWRLESYKSKAAGRLRGGRNQPTVHCVAAALLSLSLKNHYCLVPR